MRKIIYDPQILSGKPVFEGTRIAVIHILEELAEGATYEQILSAYPRLSEEDIRAAIRFATKSVEKQTDYSSSV